MKEFTIAKITKLGDYDEKYGQRFWAEVSEQLVPVMFNSMTQDIPVGAHITAEEVLLKTSAKGVEYHGLKKVKIVDGSQTTHTSSTSTTANDAEVTTLNQILEIVQDNNAMLNKLLSSEFAPKIDTVVEPTEEPVNLDDIPF